jgi:hypothetical protein
MTLKHVEYESGDLRRQNTKVIRQYDEKYSEEKSVPVFPEIFIEGTKMFHSYKDRAKGKGQRARGSLTLCIL